MAAKLELIIWSKGWQVEDETIPTGEERNYWRKVSVEKVTDLVIQASYSTYTTIVHVPMGEDEEQTVVLNRKRPSFTVYGACTSNPDADDSPRGTLIITHISAPEPDQEPAKISDPQPSLSAEAEVDVVARAVVVDAALREAERGPLEIVN